MGPAILFLLVFIPLVTAYANDYDKPLMFQCPTGQTIRSITSRHDNEHEDRQFDFECYSTPYLSTCEWSGYVNSFDEPLLYQCPPTSLIAGVSSYHDNHHEDRRFKFYCCKLLSSRRLSSCSFGAYVNEYDEEFNHVFTSGKYLKGVFSYHSNYFEDRRWQFEVCSIVAA